MLEAGTLDETRKIVEITNGNILPIGQHPSESLSWWRARDDAGFCLID
jgi:hypothetical protein